MRRKWLLLGLPVLALAWPLFQVYQNQHYATELNRARNEINANRFQSASERLASLASRWPDQSEVLLPLGVCQAAQGQIDRALGTWGQIPPKAKESLEASFLRGRLALENGQYRLAEECLNRVARGSTELANDARQALGKLLWFSGRSVEFARLLRESWVFSRDPAGTLRTLWQLDADDHPIDAIRESLNKAGESAPDDDRVWLGQADLATRSGQFTEADAWLARCEKTRANDPDVALGRLNLAVSSSRPDLAAQALKHISADRVSPARIQSLRAWFAAQRGDHPTESAALTESISLNPGDSAALERLAVLAASSKQPDRAAEYRRRKAEVNFDKEAYRKLLTEPDLTPHSKELAKLAENLGRKFDARCWWVLHSRRAGDDAESRSAIDRLDRETPPAPPSSQTLADLIPLPDDPKSTLSNSRQTIPKFTDAAERLGLKFHFETGESPERQLPETMSGGVALLDFDSDGWLDVFALQGGKFPPNSDITLSNDRLFRNRGDGTFEDVSERSLIAHMPGGYGHGVAVGDYDNDGRPDLFITRWQSYSLYRNRGDGRFEDVTQDVGLGGNRNWPTSAAWADLDGDGDLDLYVCHYLAWNSKNPRLCQKPDGQGHTYCDPRDFDALPDHVFRNDGGKKFVDVSAQAGLIANDGRGLGVVAADLDDDGKIDLFVANDTTANLFYKNLGDFKFREEGTEAGLAGNANGSFLAGMGVACGDLDGDGITDLAVTNFYGESTTFYRGLGGGQFGDSTASIGLAAPTRFLLGFGIAFFDADNDGRRDVAIANGHVNNYQPTTPYAMPALFMMGTEGGRLVDVSRQAGPPWLVPRLGRGLAVGDIDNDGRQDIVIVCRDANLAIFHNETSSGQFLSLRLEGTTSNRDGVGAKVTVITKKRRQISQRIGGGSYLSASDAGLHFGLAESDKVDRIEVRWPSGKTDTFQNLDANRGYLLREGSSEAKALPGWTLPK